MAAAKLTEQDIRIFLMDKKELNPLLRGVRWSAEDIDRAIVHSIDYFNETPPTVVFYTPASFPYKNALLTGVSGHLLKSASINEANNQFTYSADGVAIQDKDKAELFARLGADLWNDFKERVLQLKVQANVSAAFGSAPSELMYVAR